jgi:hypothetical protein
MAMKNWLVYHDGKKITAVEWSRKAEDMILKNGYQFYGCPAAKTAEDAVSYIESMI